MLDGRIEVHTEFYDPVVLETGRIDLHRFADGPRLYRRPKAASEATVLGVCSSADEGLMSSLMNLHGSDAADVEVAGNHQVRDLRRTAGDQDSDDGPRRANAR